MKFTAQEEYGLRCLLVIAQNPGATLPEIARREGLTESHVAKLMMILRKADLVESTRGQTGGYVLSRPADQIPVGAVMDALGGRLYDDSFCERHAGKGEVCAHDEGCSVRDLWRRVQEAVDGVLVSVTLADLRKGEEKERIQVQLQAPAGVRGRR